MEARKKNRSFSMDIAREICTDSFYTVNGGLPRVPLTAVANEVEKRSAKLGSGNMELEM